MQETLQSIKINKTKNRVNVIFPYRTSNGIWCFDDKDLDIVAEPFVGNINAMIDIFAQGSENIIAFISHSPIPNATLCLIKREDEGEGWYQLEGTNEIGWLCGCTLNYFETYPDKIYVKIEIPKS